MDLKWIGAQHDHIRQHLRSERSLDARFERDERTGAGIRRQRRLDGDALLRQPASGRLAIRGLPIDGVMKSSHRIDADGGRPVAAEDEPRAQAPAVG